jgi:imidazolonepropionase-like amidohydrolase
MLVSMRILAILVVFATSTPLLVHSQLMIRNVSLIDVDSQKIFTGRDVLIDKGLIQQVGKRLKVIAPIKIIDGKGKFLMPGLVDAHVHFFQSGGIYTRPDAIDLRHRKSYHEEIDWVHKNMENFCKRYVKAGITTVIDVGSTENFLKQRDTFQNKEYAPSIYMAGPLLTTWEPDVFRNLKGDEPFNLMRNPIDAQRFVNLQLKFKPDLFKIWFIVDNKNKDSIARVYLPWVKAAIDEAHKKKIRVAVHATERIAAQLSVEAGADFLVHGIDDELITDPFVELLRSHKVVLSPTLVVADNYDKVFGGTYTVTEADRKYADPTPLNSINDLKRPGDSALARKYREYVKRNAQRSVREDSIRAINLIKLINGGVIIATGTDAGNIGTQHVSSYMAELEAMQKAGLNNWQIIQASTINGARAIGKENEFGNIQKGKRADLLLLNNNPLENITNLNSIELIINKGTLVNF